MAGLPGLDGTRATTDLQPGAPTRTPQRPGILGPKHLPESFRRDWVMNANDSYWTPNDKVRLTGYPRIIGCEDCERTMRTKVVMSYVRDQLEERQGDADDAARRTSTPTACTPPRSPARAGGSTRSATRPA